MNFKDKVVVVTGGTRGIGKSIADLFLSEGASVVIGARALISSSAFVPSSEVLQVEMDVRSRNDHVALAQKAFQWKKRIDVWINNAGISQWKPLEKIDEDFLHLLLATNVEGVLWGSQAAAAHLPAGGSILNISSLAGKRGSANNSVYCATKFAVNGITQSLAKELGPRGIRVNAVCPVYVKTETLLESLRESESPTGGKNIDDYFKDFAGSQAALRRLPQGNEVASACAFLVSSAASAITGQCINIDCGVLPQ